MTLEAQTTTPGTPAPQDGPRTSLLRALSRRSTALSSVSVTVFLIVVVVFFSLVTENFLSYPNVVNIIATASVLLIVSLGQALTVISGGFDLSVGGVVPLGAVAYAVLTSGGMSALPAIVLAVALGGVVGLVNAVLIGRVGINPLIATLGTMSIATGVAFTLAKGITVPVPLTGGFLGDTGPGRIPNFVWVAIVLTVLVHVMLRRTGLGRRIYVVGGNAEAARVAGIRVGLVRSTVYILSGALAAFAGVIYASQLLAASGSVGNSTALQSIAAVVLGGAAIAGGIGGVPGTVLGVLILGCVANGLSLMQVPAFYVQVVTGAVLLLAVGFSRAQQRIGERS